MSVKGTLSPLAWETEFFGIHSALVQIDQRAEELDVATLDNYALVQAKIPASRLDLLDGLQAMGFRLAEGDIDFSIDITGQIADPKLDTAILGDIPLLRQQASDAFRYSRFRAPWYDVGDSGRFYAQWVENAVRGTFDHSCLLLRDSDRGYRGFVTLRQINDSEARIGLLAGRGVGAELMQAAMHWCQSRRLSRLYVATQISNSAAIRRYIQSGAVVNGSAYWLYR